MRFFLVFIILLGQKLIACALCANYTPTTFVDFDFNASNDKLNAINISWKFSQEFTQVLLGNYDTNYNNKFDANEIEDVKEAFLNYLEPNNHLSEILLYEDEKTLPLEIQFKDIAFSLNDSQFLYEYQILLNIDLKDKKIFNLKIHDPNVFFKFDFQNAKEFQINDDFFLSANPNLEFVFFQILKGKMEKQTQEKLPTQNTQNKKEEINFQKLNNDFFAFIKELLKKEPNLKNLFFLIILSFAYGAFHATGPGHAKTLTSSCFLTHQSSYKKILYFCLKIGILHILSAFLIVSLILLFLNVFIHSISNNASFIIAKISSLIIIFIALFMLIKKFTKRNHKENCPCCNPHKINEFAIISASAIVPCPGVLLLFVFAYEFNSFYACISAIFISLGMAFILFVFACLANKIHFKAKNQKIRLCLEYLGIIFMLLFGIFIFINTKSSIF